MVRRLFCRVGVVLSVTLVAVLAGSSSLFAQSASSVTKEITLSCQSTRLETVLDKISQRTGVSFIYSPSVLDLNKTVTISVQQQPLSKVLNQLAKELNFTFRAEGKYVIIKKSEFIAKRPDLKGSPATTNTTLIASATMPVSLIDKISQQKHVEYLSSLSSSSLGNASVRLPETTSMKPLSVIAPQGILHKQWFGSIGLVANGYTHGGAEVRGGIKPLYGVINLGLLDQGKYRVGYGLGTSASVSNKVSVNLIYNYGRVYGQNDLSLKTETEHLIIERNYNVKMHHNQLKVMIQYDIHPRFYVNFGSSFNLLTSNYQLQNVYTSPGVISSFTPSGGFQTSGTDFTYSERHIITPLRPANQSFQTNHAWVSWELGVFYRVNFQ